MHDEYTSRIDECIETSVLICMMNVLDNTKQMCMKTLVLICMMRIGRHRVM